uniref:hypothetical protein n=1 Tax=Alistipes sp. TaxID=1872444 RepID=UPI0040566272
MDPELKILLEQLISAISTPSESDINALAMSLTGIIMSCLVSIILGYITYILGKRQNEIAEQQAAMQKQQCEIAEYEIYKEMHRDVYKLYQYTRLVLPVIYDYFASKTAKDQITKVEDLEKIFCDLANKIAVDEADFVMRKGKNKEINEAFIFASLVEFLLGIIPAYVKKDRPEQSDIMALNMARMQYKTDEDWIKAIAPHAPNDDVLKATISQFIEEKNRLFESEDNLLVKIRTLYKNGINE